MANRYWVGGTASWDGTAGTKWSDTSGGAGGFSVPTTADDVFFSALSTGTCTIATGNTGAKSIDCTGFTGGIAGTAAISVAGSITLVAGQTYTHTGTVTLTGTGTLTTAGKSFGDLVVDGVGITVTLGDALTSAAGRNMVVTRGTFTTSASNYNVTTGALSSTNSNIRTITLNGSTVTIPSGVQFQTSTNLTFNANTSQINVSGDSVAFQGGSQTFNNVSFTGTGIGTKNITGANTFNNLTFNSLPSNGNYLIQISANQTVSNTLTLGTTNAAVRRMFVFSDTVGTSRTITAATIATLSDVDFRDITAAGASGTWSGTRLGNCLGNTNITFDAGKTVYWNLTGTQTWLSTGWALGSGGTPSVNNFPLAQDTAIFDDAGAATTVTAPNTNDFGAFNYGTIDMSARTTSFTFGIAATTNHYGSLILSSAITLNTGGFTLSFLGRGVTQTFTSAGKSFANGITINNLTGSVVLGSALTQTNNAITHTSGTFDAASYNVTIPQFSSNNSNTRTLTLGNGLWTLTGTSVVWTTAITTGLTFNKGSSDILLSDNSTTARVFGGGALTYNKLTIGGSTSTSTCTLQGAATFSELASTKTVAHTIAFQANQTITTWSVKGTTGNVVTVNSSSTGTQRTVNVTNKTDGIDYLNVRDISNSNIAPITFYAGANSTNSGNNNGIAFIASSTASPQTAYLLTSGTTFTVPSDWNSSNNNIYMIGAGGGGAAGAASGNNRAAGGGGGGGAFTQLTNFTATPSSSITYAIGTSASNTNGGNTTWDSGTYIANGGSTGTATTTPSSAGGAGGTAQTVSGIITAAYAGGNGGAGAFGTTIATGYGSGAGGGAGGPNGVGGNGGTGFGGISQALIAGGGGGGNGGGSNGGNAAALVFGNGGNNFAGIGGATTVNTAGTFGGGGSGAINSGAGGSGGSGIDILNTLGGSGGKGGASQSTAGANAGLYGGGSHGGTVTTAGGLGNAGVGSQGVIFIVYVPGATPTANGNFFFMMGM